MAELFYMYCINIKVSVVLKPLTVILTLTCQLLHVHLACIQSNNIMYMHGWMVLNGNPYLTYHLDYILIEFWVNNLLRVPHGLLSVPRRLLSVPQRLLTCTCKVPKPLGYFPDLLVAIKRFEHFKGAIKSSTRFNTTYLWHKYDLNNLISLNDYDIDRGRWMTR